MSRLKKVREIIVCEVELLIEHELKDGESLAGWTLLQKTLLKLAGDADRIVQAIKRAREEASVN